MEDSNFRKGDAKTAIFGSEKMLQASPVDKIPMVLPPRKSRIRWLKTKRLHRHSPA